MALTTMFWGLGLRLLSFHDRVRSVGPQAFKYHVPRLRLLALRRDIDLGLLLCYAPPIVLQLKPHVRIRLSGLVLYALCMMEALPFNPSPRSR